jgi:hypothetical protein
LGRDNKIGERNISSLNIAQIGQALFKRFRQVSHRIQRQHLNDAPDLRLLRPRRERPCRGSAAQK